MKTRYIYASFLAASLLFAGCQDLDTFPEGGMVTSSQKEEVAEMNPERAEAQVNAIFATFSQYMPNSSALGANRHNDIGYPTIILAMNSNGADVVSDNNGYNWAGYDLTFEDRQYTMNECQMVWNDLYSIIFAANNVIATYDENTQEPQELFYLGQGLGARAFAYWVLAQLYQFNYVGNENELCVPLITNENSEDAAVNGCSRSTVSVIYEQIKSDLDAAISALTVAQSENITRTDKRYISLSVAYGLRARMYLSMQKWSEAASDAKNAIDYAEADGLYMTDLSAQNSGKPSFWSSDESNWMWGIIVNETDDVVTSGIVNFPSHMGSLNYGYANYSGGMQISKALYKEIDDTDGRKTWWLDETANSASLDASQLAFAQMYYGPYTQMKFAPYNNQVGTAINANDIPLMRIEEMYLIKAEAEGMQNASNGKTALEEFLKMRVGNPSVYTSGLNTSEAVQEAIYLQRRIEFWGEGITWFDLMRLNKGVDRRGAGYPNPSSVFNIQPGDNILLWRIPEAEIQANKGLTEADYIPVNLPTAVADE